MAILIEQNRKLEINRAEELKQLKAEIQAASESLRLLISQPPSDSVVKEMSSKLLDWAEHAALLKREQAIISSLRFDGMLYRREDIPHAHTDTFQWAFKPELCLAEWLESDDGIYWVSGDPGSGKSMLIKHLSSHERTRQVLRKWAGGRKLVTANFFFWFSGTPLQKSQEGLLRSLLFELLRQCPSSIQAVCPSRWQSTTSYPWEKEELMETILLLRLQQPLLKFCFFIDGLDEYRGEPGAENGNNVAWHVSEIICIVEALSRLPDVKLCISSRPWRAFEKAFGGLNSRKLYVNDENRDDIRLYIRDKFERSNAFTESAYKSEELAALVDEMVEDSRGVFIWVFLVVESLLRGLSNEDRLVELRRRLSQTPKTLNELFERMLSSVEDIYQEQAAQILQVALRATGPLYVIVYSFIGDEEHDALKIETKQWTAEECVTASKTAEIRIKVRCPDIIKIKTPSPLPTTTEMMVHHQVDFLHRTVRDFLALEETQNRLNQRLTRPFDPGMFICRGLLTQIKGASATGQDGWSRPSGKLWRLLHEITLYAGDLEKRTGKPQTELLDELQRVIARQTGRVDVLLAPDSFVGVMVRRNVYLYVETKLPGALDSSGTPLLECALMPSPHVGPHPKMVALLLKHGAGPAGGGRHSAWHDYLCWLYNMHESSFKLSFKEARDTHLSAIQLMLEHGADPRIQCLVPLPREVKPKAVRGKGYQSALEIIQAIFTPDERGLIEALLNEPQGGDQAAHPPAPCPEAPDLDTSPAPRAGGGFLGVLGWFQRK